jgi:PilZ domain
MMERPTKTTPGSVARNSTEKRSCPRYPFSPSVEAIDVKGKSRIVGRLSDIGRNGCYVDTISPFAAEAEVTLTITKEDQSFRTEAKVVYSQIGMGMGLLFTTAEPEQLRLLGVWLRELGGGKSETKEAANPAIQPVTVQSVDRELQNVVNELVSLLMRKNVVNDSEGQAILRKLSK